MAGTEDFTSKIVSVVVAVIVVAAVAIPVINGLLTGVGAPTGTTKTIIEILPVFLVLAILMIVVKLFMGKKY